MVLAMSAISLSAQEGLTGTWNGVLSIPGAELALVVHIDPAGCTMDSPDQDVPWTVLTREHMESQPN